MPSEDSRVLVPYGWWPSSIGADLVAARSTSYDAVHTTGDSVAWLETRPADGCAVVVTWTPGQGTRDATPDGFDVGTSIHAYGGGAYTYTPAGLVVVNADDQRLHLIDPDGAPRPITPPGDDRYGDLRPLDATTLIGVRERPGGPDELVVLPFDGSAPPRRVHEGHDFYAFPRASRDRRQLAWITWDNPNLPWDGSDLWVADLLSAGQHTRLGPARHVAGGTHESVTQPEWGPDDALHFVSDRSGWWNLHRARDQRVEPLLSMSAEFADAAWELDYSTYACLPDGRIACRYRRHGLDHLGILNPATGDLQPLSVPFTSIKPYLRATSDRLASIAANPTTTAAVVTLRLSDHALDILASDDPACTPTTSPRPNCSESRPPTAALCTLPTTHPPTTPSPGPSSSVPR